jgi:hypothetical protein
MEPTKLTEAVELVARRHIHPRDHLLAMPCMALVVNNGYLQNQ